MEDTASQSRELFLVNTTGSALGNMVGTELLKPMPPCWPWFTPTWEPASVTQAACRTAVQQWCGADEADAGMMAKMILKNDPSRLLRRWKSRSRALETYC